MLITKKLLLSQRSGLKVYDDFNRADNAELGRAITGQPWVESLSDCKIESNALVPNAALAVILPTIIDGLLNKKIDLTVYTGNAVTQAWGPILRYFDSLNYLRVYISTAGDVIALHKTENGAGTILASTVVTIDISTSYTLSITMKNNVIIASLDGVQHINTISNFLQGVSLGGVHMYVSDLTGTPYADEYRVEAI